MENWLGEESRLKDFLTMTNLLFQLHLQHLIEDTLTILTLLKVARKIDPKDLLISVNGKHFEHGKDWEISSSGYTLGERDRLITIDPLFKYQNTSLEYKPDDAEYFNLYNIIITSKS